MPAAVNSDFLMSTEEECLTATPDAPEQVDVAMHELLRAMSSLAPTLPGPAGLFNVYGRAYIDCGHIELAMPECHSPYVLALVAERQRRVVAAARDQLAKRGTRLLLANNNHSGLLHRGCPVWGAHENYLVERHPTEFTPLVLPFLVTRIYAGAGGVEYPTGAFLAAVRPTCMEEVTGGSTTQCRAIHSTCRDEHHQGAVPLRFRYHGILGDGHRSQFNQALQFGATALALKAILFDGRLPRDLAGIRGLADGDWLGTLQRLNVLQAAGGELRVDPLIVQVQRIYLDAAQRFVERLDAVPSWIPDLLRDWDATLRALAALDRPWLAARLDAFAKYEFYSSVLAGQGYTWRDLPQQPPRFAELALLDHSYHNFCDPESVFSLLERDGLLEHRVGPCIPPGEEVDPFVPECATRARARARFIKEHAGQDHLVVDWSRVWDRREQRVATLEDPFAIEFSAWTPLAGGSSPPVHPPGRERTARSIRQLRDLLGLADDTPF